MVGEFQDGVFKNDVMKDLTKMPIEELRKLKQKVIEEISRRDAENENSRAFGRLFSVVSDSPCGTRYYQPFEQNLRRIATFTEKEFSTHVGVGPAVMRAAKIELQKLGLSFQPEKDGPTQNQV